MVAHTTLLEISCTGSYLFFGLIGQPLNNSQSFLQQVLVPLLIVLFVGRQVETGRTSQVLVYQSKYDENT